MKSQETIDKAIELVKSGKTYQEAGDEVGVSKSTVWKWAKAAGLVKSKTKHKKKEKETKPEPKDDHIVEPIWVNKDIITIGEQVVRRYRPSSDRFYYTFDEMGDPRFSISVTSIIDKVGRNKEGLEEWKRKNPDHEEIAQDRADYGTIMHHLFADIILGGKTLDEQTLYDIIVFLAEGLHRNERWVRGYFKDWRKDMIALTQWIVDYKIDPVAVELCLVDEQTGIGGALDFVHFLWEDVEDYWFDEEGNPEEVYKSSSSKYGYKKGDHKKSKRPQRFLCITDFKSGRKGFYSSHEEQLAFYKHLFEKNYPDLKVDRLYNWSPKDWRENPGYNFTEQTNKVSQKRLNWMLEGIKIMWEEGDIRVPGKFTTFGDLVPGVDPAGNWKKLSAKEYVINKLNNR